MSLLETLMGTMLSDKTTEVLSEKSGADTNQVADIVKSALPVLLQSMVNNSNDSKGADSLATALSNHASSGNTTTKAVATADTTDGLKIIKHLLGSNTSDVTKTIASSTNTSKSQVETILSSLAPTLMSLIGKQIFSGSSSSSSSSSGDGLSSLLVNLLGGSSSSSKKSSSSGFDIGSLVSMAMSDNDKDGKNDILEALSGLFGK